jgi:phosphoglycolate phosphatase-like HAD superfamily hydrolase
MTNSPLAMLFDDDALLMYGNLPYDGVVEMLRGLRSAGYPLGVLTRSSRTAWEAVDERLGLGPFAAVLPLDAAGGAAALGEAILAATTALDLAPGLVAYITGSPASGDAISAVGARVGEAGWAARALTPAEDDGATRMEWRFARPADVTRTFAAWC